MEKSSFKTRASASALLLSLLAASLAACGSGTEVPADQNGIQTTTAIAAENENAEPDIYDARKQISDDLPEADFGGAEYRIFCYGGNGSMYYEIPEETGDVIDDAVLSRNRTIEERFNCNIKVALDAEYAEGPKLISNAISAGEDAYDIIAFQVVQTGLLVPKGYFMNWYDVPHINFDKPWWSDSNKKDLTINDACFIAVGDMLITAVGNTYCVYYNKQIGQNYDMPDLFQTVNDGKWTFDYMVELSKDVYEDLNQNGAVDATDDRFGYVTNAWSNVNTYLWAFDNPVFRMEDGVPVYTFRTEKINDIATKLVDSFYQYKGLHTDIASAHGYAGDMFRRSLSMFANGSIGNAISTFRDMTDDFSILPYPKWNEAQDHYITMVDGSHESMQVPITASDLDRIGIITEALCAESYKTVFPAYYDVALKVKGARDEESVAMLDKILESRVFDFGYVYDGWNGASFLLQTMMQDKNTNFESFYAKKEKSILKYYNKVIDYFNNYES
ncbi:MAG: hypothetical protein MJ175_11535 [Clostridia bacterium]|nr:hypothetical protein [Clostridia bacterium]